MKKVIAFLFATVFCAYLNAEDIYESNILGMKLRQIRSEYDAETEYTLTVVIREGVEVRDLKKKGSLYARTTIKREGSGTTEVTEKDDLTETVIRQNGIIVTEQTEKPGEAAERTDYIYSSKMLDHTDFFLGDEKIYSDKYFYTEEGRLLDVKRTFDGGQNDSLISFIFNDGRVARYWFSDSKQHAYIRFGKKGISYSELQPAVGPGQTRTYEESADGGRIEIITDLKSGLKTTLTYDPDGRLIRSVLNSAEGKRVEVSEWFFRSGLLAEMVVRRDLSTERFRYEYSRDNELSKETYSKNGNLVQVTEYEDSANFSEVLYKNGEAVLKINYQNGVRTGTEQLQE